MFKFPGFAKNPLKFMFLWEKSPPTEGLRTAGVSPDVTPGASPDVTFEQLSDVTSGILLGVTSGLVRSDSVGTESARMTR